MSNEKLSDFEIIRAALKALQHLAGGMKYGGLMREYESSLAAIEALERIESPMLPGFGEPPLNETYTGEG